MKYPIESKEWILERIERLKELNKHGSHEFAISQNRAELTSLARKLSLIDAD